MSYPTIARYAASVAHPRGLFRTLGEPVCERDIYGEPRLFAGGTAVVFKIRSGRKYYALKCYQKPHTRTGTLCGLAAGAGDQLLCPARYLPEELYVYGPSGAGEWHDVTLAEWVEGETLDTFLVKALRSGEREKISRLAETFDRAAVHLLAQEWAHGDLKPDNIFLTPDGALKLIDLDAMYFPVLDGSLTEEPGTPLYQHPLRGTHFYNGHIDDYPVALISATLHLLALRPGLFARFGNRDRFLFTPAEIFAGCQAYETARTLAAQEGDGPLYTLLLMLRSPTPSLPGLGEIISALIPETTTCSSAEMYAYNRAGRWGYSGGEERTIIPPVYDSALEFTEGLAAVNIGGYHHFIGPDGRCAVNCSVYEAIKPFRAGVAAVRRDGLWGFIDTRGNEVMPPSLDKAPRSRSASNINYYLTGCTNQG